MEDDFNIMHIVTTVTPVDNYKLLLTFDNGEERIFDAAPLLKERVFAPLKSMSFFKRVQVEDGTVVWPEDLDYCPDTLYMQSIPVNT